MPRMNGWEVLDVLAREKAGRLGYVIVLSAAIPKKGLAPEVAGNVHAVMAKPFDLEELLVAIRTCVDGGGRRTERSNGTRSDRVHDHGVCGCGWRFRVRYGTLLFNRDNSEAAIPWICSGSNGSRTTADTLNR